LRILAVPAAILIACCIYMPLPAAADFFARQITRAYGGVLRLFTRRTGQADAAPALLVFVLLMMGVFALLGAIHPLLSALLMAPAFTGLTILPRCAAVKAELDAGKYARDIPAYEDRVRDMCASLAPAFIRGVVCPMILCALGMPLHLGAALAAVYTVMCVLEDRPPFTARFCAAAQRIGERIFIFFMLLCCSTVGRNPLHTRGSRAQDRLLSILAISEKDASSRAPMAGDIAQGVFLCAFSCVILCFALCAVGFVLCR